MERIHRELRFVASTMVSILDNLPAQRRTLSDSTKTLHARVTWLRRNGYCPCCQRAPVCDHNGKLMGAEHDHFYGRHRNGPDETWLVCGSCNRSLEVADFKTQARSAFEAYQAALRLFLEDGQSRLF